MAGGIKVTIGANTGPFAKGLQSINRRITTWARRLPGRFARAGIAAGRRFVRGLTRTIRRGVMAAGAIGAGLIGKSISEAGRFEKYGLQFEALLGSADAAEKRMNEIKQVDLEVPFDITQIADASRVLTVFTENAFAGADALKVMADAAAVTPRPLKEIAYWYGRAYSMIQAGRPLGEAVMRLTEMGLVSAEASIQLQRLSKSYSPEAQAKKIAIINAEFMKFEGSAAKLVTTWPGIVSVFTSGTKQAFDAVGKSILPLAKVWLQEIIDLMAKLRNEGTLARWGTNVAWALHDVRESIEKIMPKVKEFFDRFTKYISDFQQSVNNDGFRNALGDAVEEALATAVVRLEKAVEDHGPAIGAIGAEIAWHLVKGFTKGLAKSKLGRGLTSILTLGGSEFYRDFEEMRVGSRGVAQARTDLGGIGGLTPDMIMGSTRADIKRMQGMPGAPSWLQDFPTNAGAQRVYIEGLSEAAKEKINPTQTGGM